MNNALIRKTAKKSGVKLWEIADKLGIQDSAFSRKLRRELPEEEQRRIIGIIETLAKEAEEDA